MKSLNNIKALHDLYIGLNNGKRYCLRSRFLSEAQLYASGEHRYFTPQIAMSADPEYIYYTHYGSSAIKNTIEGLEWLLEFIFKDEASAFVEYPE